LYAYFILIQKRSQWPECIEIISELKQEGQHPLTEQRAANFRLLANQ